MMRIVPFFVRRRGSLGNNESVYSCGDYDDARASRLRKFLEMPFSASRFLLYAALVLTPVAIPGLMMLAAAPGSTAPHTFTVSGKQFLMDGKPYQIIAGEMHYPRIPREYWKDRLRKAKRMGLNTITTYVFWNVHEARPGTYDFSGQNDVAEYIREAQAEGLNVILRPGPYVCAEWELGGYPSWLLKDRSLVLRSDDPKYTAAVKSWFARLSMEIKPLLLKNGGPIIAVQVENEYGSVGDDKTYLEGVKNALIESGMGDTVLYTANPPGDLLNGSLPDLPTVINFGTGNAEKSFAKLEELRPDGPRMSGEYWAGWFDHWGGKHNETDGNKEAAELGWMLHQGYSVNLYIFEGGTNFGWMNGANTDGKNYQPDTTSYDYDAPLDEKGVPRAKFYAFQKTIKAVAKSKPRAVPKQQPSKAFPVAQQMLTASLWRNLPTPVNSKIPLTFEDLDQSYGYVLYRTGLDEGDGGKLALEGLHDYAQIYIDQQLVGTLDRRLGKYDIEVPRQTHAATLDILVENTGRLNFTNAIRTERKGLTGGLTLAGKEPKNWEIYSLPMDDLSNLRFLPEPCTGPCFFHAELIANKPADTYLDTRGLHKGMVWLARHPLGRFWSIGPQFALYTPAPWIQPGRNTITWFDLQGDANEHLNSTTEPIFDTTASTRD
jgi:beta-galactosidase